MLTLNQYVFAECRFGALSNVKQTRGSEGCYVLLQEREDLGLIEKWELSGGGNFLGSLKHVYIALSDAESVCVLLVTSS